MLSWAQIIYRIFVFLVFAVSFGVIAFCLWGCAGKTIPANVQSFPAQDFDVLAYGYYGNDTWCATKNKEIVDCFSGEELKDFVVMRTDAAIKIREYTLKLIESCESWSYEEKK